MDIFSNRIIAYILKVFLALIAVDMLSRTILAPKQPMESQIKSEETKEPHINKPNVPESFPSSGVSIEPETEDLVTVLYCASCSGYKKEYETLSSQLRESIPGINIVGSDYPIKTSHKLLSKLIFVLQILIFIFMSFGERIFAKLGIPTPAFYDKVVQYKTYIFLGLFLVGNHLQSMLTSSGAFEVYFGKRLIYSKLHLKELPSHDLLYTLIKENMGSIN